MALDQEQRTWRVFLLCSTVAILGAFTFAYKVDACKDKPAQVQECKEEFFEIKYNSDDRDHVATHTCTPGAVVEIVSSPPAPRPGIMCHCVSNTRTKPPTVGQ
jgi:hypothetical protein